MHHDYVLRRTPATRKSLEWSANPGSEVTSGQNIGKIEQIEAIFWGVRIAKEKNSR